MPHPMQPLELADDGVIRFRSNAVIRHLFDSGVLDLNAIAVGGFSDEDQMQLAQQLGYSVSAFGGLSYVSADVAEAADAAAARVLSERHKAAVGAASGTENVQAWASQFGANVVFVLENAGRATSGVYASVAGALAAAEETLAGYRDLFASLTPAEQEETEQVHERLEWTLARATIPDRAGGHPIGAPRPVARYSESSSFTLRAEPVHR